MNTISVVRLYMRQVMKIGMQPINIQASAYYNVERPDNAAKYQLRLQIQLMFPKQASSSTGDVIA